MNIKKDVSLFQGFKKVLTGGSKDIHKNSDENNKPFLTKEAKKQFIKAHTDKKDNKLKSSQINQSIREGKYLYKDKEYALDFNPATVRTILTTLLHKMKTKPNFFASEGLYRTSGNSLKVGVFNMDVIKNDGDISNLNFDELSANELATVSKQWFGRLFDSKAKSIMVDRFSQEIDKVARKDIASLKDSSTDEAKAELQKYVDKGRSILMEACNDPSTKEVFNQIVDFFKDISDNEDKTKMTADNLGTAVGVTLFVDSTKNPGLAGLFGADFKQFLGLILTTPADQENTFKSNSGINASNIVQMNVESIVTPKENTPEEKSISELSDSQNSLDRDIQNNKRPPIPKHPVPRRFQNNQIESEPVVMRVKSKETEGDMSEMTPAQKAERRHGGVLKHPVLPPKPEL